MSLFFWGGGDTEADRSSLSASWDSAVDAETSPRVG
jgi:hypothetical protein